MLDVPNQLAYTIHLERLILFPDFHSFLSFLPIPQVHYWAKISDSFRIWPSPIHCSLKII